MLRRQARLRREYLYRKSVEEQKRTIVEKKRRLKTALDDMTPIPTDLQREAVDLQKQMKFDDAVRIGMRMRMRGERRKRRWQKWNE